MRRTQLLNRTAPPPVSSEAFAVVHNFPDFSPDPGGVRRSSALEWVIGGSGGPLLPFDPGAGVSSDAKFLLETPPTASDVRKNDGGSFRARSDSLKAAAETSAGAAEA